MLRPAALNAAGSRRLTLDGGLRAHLQQLLAQWAFDTLAVLRGVPFLIMLILALVNVLAILALSGQLYGTATYPVTHRMLETVEGGFQVMLYIILTFYAGELVWRERGAGVAEVSDAFPTPDWVPLVAKLLALFATINAVLVAPTMLSTGTLAMYSVIAVGLFNSIMFPTIFALGIERLGPMTSKASSLLIMAIVGGAVIPQLQGVLADHIGLQHAFFLPLLCYLYIVFYGISGSKIRSSVD